MQASRVGMAVIRIFTIYEEFSTAEDDFYRWEAVGKVISVVFDY